MIMKTDYVGVLRRSHIKCFLLDYTEYIVNGVYGSSKFNDLHDVLAETIKKIENEYQEKEMSNDN